MSFLRPRVRPSGRRWSLSEQASFAARRDFELLKLLSTADPSVVAVARQLGACFSDAAAGVVPLADKGAAKRAAPGRGSSVSSTTTPRKRRTRVVSSAQKAKKDANFKAKMVKLRFAEGHWLRRLVQGWAAAARAARAARVPHEAEMPLAPEAGAKRTAGDALAGAKATPVAAPPPHPQSVGGAFARLRSMGAAAAASAAAVVRIGPGREYARVGSRSRSRSRSRSPRLGSGESSGDDVSGNSGDG